MKILFFILCAFIISFYLESMEIKAVITLYVFVFCFTVFFFLNCLYDLISFWVKYFYYKTTTKNKKEKLFVITKGDLYCVVIKDKMYYSEDINDPIDNENVFTLDDVLDIKTRDSNISFENILH